jgi:hypothetical protein
MPWVQLHSLLLGAFLCSASLRGLAKFANVFLTSRRKLRPLRPHWPRQCWRDEERSEQARRFLACREFTCIGTGQLPVLVCAW